MPRKLSAETLALSLGTERCPLILDVRRKSAWQDSGRRIAGALWRDPGAVSAWLPGLATAAETVVYCAHGHNVSEMVAAALAPHRDVAVLAGGFDAWQAAGGATVRFGLPGFDDALARPSQWVTRERPKIDRVACPWLIRRFIDPTAEFRFVSAEWVSDVAGETGWVPFDVEGAFYSHRGDGCSFDTLLAEAGLTGPALEALASIVRGADTARLDLAPEAAGLLAVSLGLSALETDDARQVERGMLVYDALYAWLRHAHGERHNWPARAA